ncbi:MAG: hypothetical protein IJ088_05910 [Clostridia bacterium]|nr:hypothetical protein [Clostridia bacterium]
MKGAYTIRIHNRRVTFTLRLERNLTVICGSSATGKTTLVSYVSFYEDLGPQSGVTIESPRPCVVLRGKDWEDKLSKTKESFVFIDEGNHFISSKDFAEAVQKSDNYFILMTREDLHQLPYSIHSILQLRKTTSRFNHTYNQTYPLYDIVPEYDLKRSNLNAYLTEDSNSGNDLFEFVAKRDGIECISAGGKDHILSELQKLPDHRTMVIADGAAFGSSMALVYRYVQDHPHQVILYLPESFEWLILASGIVHSDEIDQILDHPEDYIESKDFMSWERFFTHLLESKTMGTRAQYSKRKLSDYYLEDKNVEKILACIQSGHQKHPENKK